MCINALNFGMSYEQFWHNDLSAYYIYLKSYESKRRIAVQDLDILGWYVGQYVGVSLRTNLVPIAFPMSRAEVEKCIQEYPTRPYSFTKNDTAKVQQPTVKRKINTTPPTADEIAKYNRDMLILRNKKGGGYNGNNR